MWPKLLFFLYQNLKKKPETQGPFDNFLDFFTLYNSSSCLFRQKCVFQCLLNMTGFTVQTFIYSSISSAKFDCFIQIMARQTMVQWQCFNNVYAIISTVLRTVHSFRCPIPCCFVVWLRTGIYPLCNIWKWTGRCMNLWKNKFLQVFLRITFF